MMFKIIEPYLEAVDIFEMLGEKKSELSDIDLGFIGGLIKENQPKKIVEIGVSAGGTTCFIMRTLEKLQLESEVYSIDLAYSFHINKEKECGYQIKEAKNLLSNSNKHTLILGKNIAEVIDELIGNNIDMLIMDTTHYLPGELLDFLVCYPYLSKKAVVVLDDLTFAHSGENTNAVATKILYDLVVADKIFPQNNGIYPKMAGFILNDDTPKYVLDYFSGLITPWWYGLSEKDIQAYRSVVCEKYRQDEIWLFDEAVRINTLTINKQKSIKQEIRKLIDVCRMKPALIYGVGQRGKALHMFLSDRGGEYCRTYNI